MKLVLLGTTGYHPTNERQTACMMLPELGVVLDAGTGLYRVRRRLQTDHLDIFLTHAHLDHVVGLTFLFDVLHEKNGMVARVHGEPAKLAAIREHLFAPEVFPVLPPLEFVPLLPEVMLKDGHRLTWFPLAHPGGSIGFRIDGPDGSMAYVTDTTADPKADYVEKIRGVDLLIHECYFADGQESLATLTGHSCLTPVAEVARAAEVGRLILVHVNPFDDYLRCLSLTNAKNIFRAMVLAEDEMEIEVVRPPDIVRTAPIVETAD